MLAKIIDIFEFTILVEYEDQNNLLQRKILPRELYAASMKGVPVNIPDQLLDTAMEFSNVDLIAVLGGYMESIQNVEQAMRKAGLWEQEDYRQNPGKVQKVLRMQFPKLGLDATTVINAAHTKLAHTEDG